MEKDKGCCSDIPVELEAARLAIEWKELFAAELRLAARQLATGADVVRVDHYRRALGPATASVLQAVNANCREVSDVRR